MSQQILYNVLLLTAYCCWCVIKHSRLIIVLWGLEIIIDNRALVCVCVCATSLVISLTTSRSSSHATTVTESNGWPVPLLYENLFSLANQYESHLDNEASVEGKQVREWGSRCYDRPIDVGHQDNCLLINYACLFMVSQLYWLDWPLNLFFTSYCCCCWAAWWTCYLQLYQLIY